MKLPGCFDVLYVTATGNSEGAQCVSASVCVCECVCAHACACQGLVVGCWLRNRPCWLLLAFNHIELLQILLFVYSC